MICETTGKSRRASARRQTLVGEQGISPEHSPPVQATGALQSGLHTARRDVRHLVFSCIICRFTTVSLFFITTVSSEPTSWLTAPLVSIASVQVMPRIRATHPVSRQLPKVAPREAWPQRMAAVLHQCLDLFRSSTFHCKPTLLGCEATEPFGRRSRQSS